jgi:hypothetical protein
LFQVVTQIEPPWVPLLDKGDFPAAAPALQLFLTRDRVVYVAKVLKPNKAIQLIAFREAARLSASALARAPRETIRNVNPIVVVAHGVEQISDVSLRST